jgi:hypothetical protein
MRKMLALDEKAICATPRRVGRKLEWPEKFLVSFAAGTLARLREALAEGEDARSFVREAVEREIKRRSRLK